MLRSQLVQYLCRGGITGLRLFSALHAQLFKQDHSQLFGGIDIKVFPCRFVDLLLQLFNPAHQRFPVSLQLFRIDPDSFLFHIKQGKYQRHLDLVEQLFHTGILQLLQQHRSPLPCGQRRAGSSKILMGILAGQRIDQIGRNLYIEQMFFFIRTDMAQYLLHIRGRAERHRLHHLFHLVQQICLRQEPALCQVEDLRF